MSTLLRSQSLSIMRMRESPIPATTSRVSSSDFPTLTTTSSQTWSTDRIAGTIGKSSLTALRTMVKPERMSAPELQVVEPAVHAVGGQQLPVRAPLHDPSFRHHDDEIGMLDGGEPVGDHEDGAMRHQPIDRFLHEALGLGVERAGGFVEDEDRWIAQQRPGNRDALPLPAAEPRAALAEQRVIAFGEPHDKLVGVRSACRGPHLLERRAFQ